MANLRPTAVGSPDPHRPVCYHSTGVVDADTGGVLDEESHRKEMTWGEESITKGDREMTTLVFTGSPMTVFEELVDGAAERQPAPPSQESKLYLIQLLADFVAPVQLGERTDTDPDSSVAEIFCAAVSAEGMRRLSLLKLAGDLSLFISGVLPDSLRRRAVGFGYYRQLGGTAYTTAADDCRSPEAAQIFQELALEFALMVDVLNVISEGCALSLRPDLMGFHQRWAELGSRRAERALRREGVVLQGAPGAVH